MADRVGLEPTSILVNSQVHTPGLLPANVVGDKGVEPFLTPYQSVVLTHTPIPNMVGDQGIEPCQPAYKARRAHQYTSRQHGGPDRDLNPNLLLAKQTCSH